MATQQILSSQVQDLNATIAAAITTHNAASDPHPGYMTAAEDAAIMSAHVAAANPHPGYTTSTVYTSGEVDMPLNTKVDGTHGLGSVPDIFFAVFVCKNASNAQGYAVGDEIIFNNDTVLSISSCTVWANSTLVGLTVYTDEPNIPYKDGSFSTTLEPAYWKVKLRAIKL